MSKAYFPPLLTLQTVGTASRSAALDRLYVPIDVGDELSEGGVRFRTTDGSERAVLVGGTGKHKRLKSARAVINFHLGYFPDATSVSVAVIPGKPVG